MFDRRFIFDFPSYLHKFDHGFVHPKQTEYLTWQASIVFVFILTSDFGPSWEHTFFGS